MSKHREESDDLSPNVDVHKESSSAPTRIVKLDRKRKSKEKRNPSKSMGDIKKKKSTAKHKDKGTVRDNKDSKEDKLALRKLEETTVIRDKDRGESRVKSSAEDDRLTKKSDTTNRTSSSPIKIDISDDDNRKHDEAEDAHSHLSLSVHSDDGVDEDLKSPKRDEVDNDDHDDSLDIKPPQAQAGRKEKSHKRKHKEERRHERYMRGRDWGPRDRAHAVERGRDFRDREWDHRERSDRYQPLSRHDKLPKHVHPDHRPDRPIRDAKLDARPERRVEKVDRQERVVKPDRHERINKQDRPAEHYDRPEKAERLVRIESGHERASRPDVWDRLETTKADRSEKRVERNVRLEKEHSAFDDVPRAYAPEGGSRDKQKPDESIETREARKREESQRERDRLERLERERQRERDRRAREEQEEKDREDREIKRRKQKEQIRHLTHRGDGASKREDSRNQKRGRKRSRSREDYRESNEKKAEVKARSTNKPEPADPRTPEMEYEHHVEPEEIASPDPELEEDGKLEESMEEEEHSETEGSQVETESETDSDSDSDESEVSESGSSPESESEEEVEPEEHEEEVEKLTSKFDQHSENENEAHDQATSEDEDHVPYEVTSPAMSPIEMKPELPPYYPAIQGCRNVEEFNCLNRIEEGTYGIVYRAKDKKTGDIVALKRIKIEREKEGFPITSLREINTLLKAQHSNIVTVREIVVGSNMDKIYIVMDYVEHDLKALMETMKQPFLVGEVKTLMIQLLRAVAHLHDNWILHRDLKTSNLLLSHKGILKVGDFGLAREYGSPLKRYTPIVVTLWYRAPELLLGVKEYSTAIDMWSVGCVFAELLTMKPLWPGKSEIDQLNRIFKDLGTPSEKIWPGVKELSGMKKCTFTQYSYNTIRTRFGSYLTNSGFDLLNRFLTYNPKKRVTAETSLKHEYFQESPLPVEPSMFPTWPAKSEQSRRHVSSPKPPSGGQAFAKLMGDEEQVIAAGSGFHFAAAKSQGVSAVGPGFSLKF